MLHMMSEEYVYILLEKYLSQDLKNNDPDIEFQYGGEYCRYIYIGMYTY